MPLKPGDLFVIVQTPGKGMLWAATVLNRYYLAVSIRHEYTSGTVWQVWVLDQCRMVEFMLYDYDYEIVQRL